MLERLPDHGHYKATAVHDTTNPHLWDMAAVLAAAKGDQPPTMLGWTREYSMLVAILEAVHQVAGVVIAVNTEDGRMPDTAHIPRPVTELQKAIQRQRESSRSERMRQLVPHTFVNE